MDFTFARATRGRALFPVFASPDESVRRDQRDAARFESPRSSRTRSKAVTWKRIGMGPPRGERDRMPKKKCFVPRQFRNVPTPAEPWTQCGTCDDFRYDLTRREKRIKKIVFRDPASEGYTTPASL
jgi:hypothetical protein